MHSLQLPQFGDENVWNGERQHQQMGKKEEEEEEASMHFEDYSLRIDLLPIGPGDPDLFIAKCSSENIAKDYLGYSYSYKREKIIIDIQEDLAGEMLCVYVQGRTHGEEVSSPYYLSARFAKRDQVLAPPIYKNIVPKARLQAGLASSTIDKATSSAATLLFEIIELLLQTLL
eukprot:g2326.t1